MNHLSVLIFDKDPIFSQEMANFFDSADYKPLFCDDADNILKLAKTHLPYYYILDANIITDDFLEQLNEIHKAHSTPIHILITANEKAISFGYTNSIQLVKKPFTWTALKERLNLFNPIEQYKKHSKAILEKLKRDNDEFEGVNIIRPHDALFRGNNVFVADSPTHDKHILLTHCQEPGLCAMLSNVLTHEVFSGMVRKGFAYDQIIKEINRKISSILPEDVFYSLSYLFYIAETDTIKLFNGAKAPVYAFRQSQQSMVKHEGQDINFNNTAMSLNKLNIVSLQDAKDWVVFYQDGIHFNALSAAQLLEKFQNKQDPTQYLKQLNENSSGFALTISPNHFAQGHSFYHEENTSAGVPLDLDVTFSLNADALKSWDPLPVVMHTLMEHRQLHAYRTEIFTILTELYTNALDHGVLDLDSQQKKCPNGIVAYYATKKEKLKKLKKGHIEISIKLKSKDRGGQLDFMVKDSGKGFKYQQCNDQKNIFSGRGLSLIEALCSKIEYKDKGSTVIATFHWS